MDEATRDAAPIGTALLRNEAENRERDATESNLKQAVQDVRDAEKREGEMESALAAELPPCPECGEPPSILFQWGVWRVQCGNAECGCGISACGQDARQAVSVWKSVAGNGTGGRVTAADVGYAVRRASEERAEADRARKSLESLKRRHNAIIAACELECVPCPQCGEAPIIGFEEDEGMWSVYCANESCPEMHDSCSPQPYPAIEAWNSWAEPEGDDGLRGAFETVDEVLRTLERTIRRCPECEKPAEVSRGDGGRWRVRCANGRCSHPVGDVSGPSLQAAVEWWESDVWDWCRHHGQELSIGDPQASQVRDALSRIGGMIAEVSESLGGDDD